MSKWEKIKTLSEHKGPVKCIMNLEEIETGLFTTGSEDKTVRIWSVKFNEDKASVIVNCINTLECYVMCFVFLRNFECSTMATGNSDGSIHLVKI